MRKKATILLALISMCLIATAGIGAVSASGDGGVTVGKINPDGTTTVVKTFEGNGPMAVKVTTNEDGSTDIVKEEKQISKNELCGGLGLDNCPNSYKVTSETELPVNIEAENGKITANTLEPSDEIDASAYVSCWYW